MNKKMSAIQFMEPNRLEFNKLNIPIVKRDEILIKVHRVGICATDLEIYEGNMVYFKTGQSKFPIIPGHEWSGEIVKIGEDVLGFSIGDRVVGETTLPCGKCDRCLKGIYNLCPNRIECGVLEKDGACAEYIAYPTHVLHRFTSAITFEEASLIEPTAVAYRAIKKMKVSPRDNVAVMGGGTIGLIAVQIAKIFGANTVTLIDINDQRLEIGKELGADNVINAADGDIVEKTKEITGNKMFTSIIEASGSPIAINNTLDIICPGGTICLVGLCGGKVAEINTDIIVANDLKLYGSLGSPNVWQEVISLLENKKINLKRLITHRYNLDQFEEALNLMRQNDPSCIKIIVDIP